MRVLSKSLEYLSWCPLDYFLTFIFSKVLTSYQIGLVSSAYLVVVKRALKTGLTRHRLTTLMATR